MARRLRIRHTTRVSYAQPAASSHNEVRMTPLTLPGQTTLDARVIRTSLCEEEAGWA